jgi:hypothetical protein
LVPVINDEGFVVAESGAVLIYLVEKVAKLAGFRCPIANFLHHADGEKRGGGRKEIMEQLETGDEHTGWKVAKL